MTSLGNCEPDFRFVPSRNFSKSSDGSWQRHDDQEAILSLDDVEFPPQDPEVVMRNLNEGIHWGWR